MKKIVRLLTLIFLLIIPTSLATANTLDFKDVSQTFWAYHEIQWAQENQLVKGYNDGSFKPNNTLTESQLLVILFNYFQLQEDEVLSPEHWADGLYQLASKYGLPLNGYKSIKARDSAVTRGTLAQVLAKTQGENSDLEQSVDWLYESGITTGRTHIKGTKMEQYEPSGVITRAQTAVFFKRLSDLGITQYLGLPSEETPPSIPWEDNRITLNIPDFHPGKAYFPANDQNAVHPSNSNWNGVSRFSGPEEIQALWDISFDYDGGPSTIRTLSNPPVIGSDGTLYIQEGYLYSSSSLGYFYAISSQGELLWKYRIGTNSISPVIGDGGIIYTVGEDSIFAFYPNGTIKWQKPLNGFHGTIALGKNNTILVGSRNINGDGCQLIAYDTNGKIKWTFDDFENPANKLGSKSPVVAADGTIYIFDNWGYLYAISETGTLKWHIKTNANTGELSLGSDGTIYIAAVMVRELDYLTNGAILAVTPDGKIKWKNTQMEPTKNTHIITSDSNVIFVAGHYKVVAMNRDDGQIIWEYLYDDDFGSSSMAADKDGKLYILWRLYNGRDEIMILDLNGRILDRMKFFNKEEEFDSGLVIGHDSSIYFSVAHSDYNKLYKLGEK